jgi:hypothetical protein
MLRRDWFPALAFSCALALGLGLYAFLRREAQPPVPHTLHQVAQIAGRLGLYHRSDVHSGVVNSRIVVSDRPLTWERANALHVGDPGHPCWSGTVAAWTGGRAFPYLIDHEYGVLWGDLLLYGDPVLIRRLMATPLPDVIEANG